MRKIIKKKLDFDLTINYFLKSLMDSNYVSDVVVSVIDFSGGDFFTMLPDPVDHEKIHEFSIGGILHKNPIQRGVIGSLPGIYEFSEIPSVTNELAEMVKIFVEKNGQNLCLIDDVIRNSSDSFQNDLELSECVVFHDLDVYYLINNLNASNALIVKCLRNSKAYWHSLCIFSKMSISDIQHKNLTASEIKNICLNAHLLVVGAYDGEGYVFWEKNQ